MSSSSHLTRNCRRTSLAPLWDRYGDAPRGVIEEGNVFTLEYGAPVEGRGYIGLEEDVLVTADGHRNLSDGLPRRPEDVETWLARQREAGPRLPG